MSRPPSPVAGAAPDELPDDELYASFDSGRLPEAAFGHREHLRAAFLYFRQSGGDLAEGALRFRAALRRFLAVHGVGHQYHETLTWAYLVLVHERASHGSFATSGEFLARHADLLDHAGGLLARYYDVRAIAASPLARRVFLLPGDERIAEARPRDAAACEPAREDR